MEISSVKNSVETVSTQIEKFLPLFQQFVSQQNVTSGGQSETNREIVTSGGQNSQSNRDSATSGGQNLGDNDRHGNEADDNVDNVPLLPGRDERRAIDYDNESDNESSRSSVDRGKSQNQSHFHRYSFLDKDMKEPKDIDENSSDNRDLLGDIFGEDAKTKPDKSEVGIVLEPSQIQILKQSWHCEHWY